MKNTIKVLFAISLFTSPSLFADSPPCPQVGSVYFTRSNLYFETTDGQFFSYYLTQKEYDELVNGGTKAQDKLVDKIVEDLCGNKRIK